MASLAAAKEIRDDAAVVAGIGGVDGIFMLNQELRRFFLVEKYVFRLPQLLLARV